MSSKYHVNISDSPPRFAPIPKLSAMETEGCLGCRICVKRTSCVYDVYREREFKPAEILDTADVLCINCMRCVQECKKNILTRARNPQYDRMGNDYWTPELIASIWKQAFNGKIPVSGAGYRGPFAGPGFDRMWTDMSEIVRPTRDGIHGREYISTVIELGHRPIRLKFDDDGMISGDLPHFVEVPIPILLSTPVNPFVSVTTKHTVVRAAGMLNTRAFVPYKDAVGPLSVEKEHLIVCLDLDTDDFSGLAGIRLVEVRYRDDIENVITHLKTAVPGIIVSIRLDIDEHTLQRCLDLARSNVDVVNLQATSKGKGFGTRADEFLTTTLREIHTHLIDHSLRDQITMLVTGGIAMAEHVAKGVACGVDGVVLDTTLAIALECRLCPDCDDREQCPVQLDSVPLEWGAQRIVNLVGSWHSQLVEVMGAMGLREVRRLRGELGRAMFFEDLEKENMSPIFGNRTRTLEESLADAKESYKKIAGVDTERAVHRFPSSKVVEAECPTRFRNSLALYKVVRTTACISCGKCAEVCEFGTHRMSGKRMLAPKSHQCRGTDVCCESNRYCVDHCPVDAIRVGVDPMWHAFGDPRWPAEMLVSTWEQAKTGYPPEHSLEYRIGASGGGFDRMQILLPQDSETRDFKPEDVDLSIPLNRRTDDKRPDVTIGIPFYGGGMSFGSISLDTMVARARAYAAFNSFTCSGEGGYPDALKKYSDHVITQVATGLFGVREETIQCARIVELKYAQGAKPGLGGHLLGDKNTPAVAKMREAVQGFPLFSPFPFHSVYSVEDHKKHVDWIKEINPNTLVSVKVSGASDVDMVAVGSYYAGAHIVHLDGSYGGTGAAPDIAKKNISMPIEYAVGKVHRFLEEEGVRDQITLIASGGCRSAWDVAKSIALGADGVVVGTAEMVALECIRCGVCESGRGCPRGIATTDPELSTLYSRDWATQRLMNLFHSWAIQLQHLLWRLGLKSVKELVGHSEFLNHLDYDGQL